MIAVSTKNFILVSYPTVGILEFVHNSPVASAKMAGSREGSSDMRCIVRASQKGFELSNLAEWRSDRKTQCAANP